MHYVYILVSLSHPTKFYIGRTTNLERRLEQHNGKTGQYSEQYAPWRVETYVAFSDETLAESFERYLKRGSGHAFLRKRLLPQLSHRKTSY